MNKDNRREFVKFMSRLSSSFKEARTNYINNWGADNTAKLLFALMEVCEIMADKYKEELEEEEDYDFF